MGKRHQPRIELKVPVRIFGTDTYGQIFTETVSTVDVSQDGAQLIGVHATLKADEIIGLTYAQKKVHFRVKWIGKVGTPQAGRVGLLNLTPEKSLWEVAFPKTAMDQYTWKAGERRQYPRVKVVLSVELQPTQGAPIWANSADLSLGGCFVEMAIPLKQDEKVKIGLWMEGVKVWFQAQVASSTPGFGIGLKFLNLSDAETASLKKFLEAKVRG